MMLFLVGLLLVVRLVGAQRCCYPDQFEIAQGVETALSKFIGLGSHIASGSLIAMDATNMRAGAFVSGTDDGKPFAYRLIQDFNKSVEYIIQETKPRCQKIPLMKKMQHCVPDVAMPTGNIYLGDKKLTIKNFAYSVKSHTVTGRATIGVTEGECIPNNEEFAGKIGFFTSMLTVVGYFNYTSGIADPAKYFTVPDYCPAAYSIAPKMYNFHDSMMILR